MMISNAIQLVSFISAQVISYSSFLRLKLSLWILIQILFFLLMPLIILVMAIVHSNWQNFATYWVVIDSFMTLTIFFRYFKNYSSVFLKVVASDEKA